MHLNRVLRVTLISLILLISSFTSFISIPHAKAESSDYTTLYFHDMFEYEGESTIDENFPIKDNDSEWPPKISDPQNFALWFATAFISYLFNESYDSYYDFLSIFSDPFAVTGMYYYEGEGTQKLEGDVTFDVYFESPLSSKFLRKDDVEVSVGWINFLDIDPDTGEIPIKEIKTNITLKPKIFGQIQKYSITLENVNHTLFPGEILFFKVKIIPSDKIIGNIIDRKIKLIPDTLKRKIADGLVNILNRSRNDFLNNIGEGLDFILTEIVDNENLTAEDIAEIANALRSTSFIYDSTSHPSSVKIPFISTSDLKETKVYYLHDENKMDINSPASDTSKSPDLDENIISWDGPIFSRNKILNDAVLSVYLNTRNLRLRKINLVATLRSGDDEIATTTTQIPRDFLLSPPRDPLTISFSEINSDFPHIPSNLTRTNHHSIMK